MMIYNDWKQAHVWTNLAYGVVGVLFVLQGLYAAGAGMLFLSWGSWMGHWKSGWWWKIDWVAMYIAFAMIICEMTSYWYIFVILPIVAFISYKYHRQWFLPIGASYVAMNVIGYLSGYFIWYSVAVFALAFAVRQSGDGRSFDNITHSIWHIITAVGFYLVLV